MLKQEIPHTGQQRRQWVWKTWAFATTIAILYFIHKNLPLPHYRLLENVYTLDPVGDKIGGPTLDPNQAYSIHGKSSMVASDIDFCSEMGNEIMLRGGNAADAAVTVALCIGSVNLQSLGIGGGAFILLWRPDSENGPNNVISIDPREAAPLAAKKHMYDGLPLLAQFGGLAVATPGELAGLWQLYSGHGSGNLLWEALFEPVVELNRRGWAAQKPWVYSVHTIHSRLLRYVDMLREGWDFIYRSDGSPAEEGDLITRPNYADTLEQIGKNGSAAIFYDPEGPIAPRLVARAAACGGIISGADFAQYQPHVAPALRFGFTADNETFDLATTGGVSSGLALIAGVNFFSYLYEKIPFKPDGLYLHRLVEAMKWVAGARSNLGDRSPKEFRALQEKFALREWAARVVDGKYNDSTTYGWPHYEPQYQLTEPKGTSHFSVVDAQGGAVSMTTTVNLLFGLLVYDNHTGVILNDEMDDFSMPGVKNAFNLTPSMYNFIAPQKRPLSLTTPTIIRKNGQLYFLIGAAGGSRIVTAVLQAIVRTIYEKLPLLNTILYPRVHHQLIPEYVMAENVTMLEQEFPGARQFLQSRNHSFAETGPLTAMNGIKWVDGEWHGVSDVWRKGGVACGS